MPTIKHRRARDRVLVSVLVVMLALAATPAAMPAAGAATTGGAEPDVTYRMEEVLEYTVPGQSDIGNHCDDCTTQVTFPFPVEFYGQTYNSAYVSSNGNIQFTGNTNSLNNGCLPNSNFGATLFLLQGDWRTTGEGDYIGQSTFGDSPNRIYTLEWNVHYFVSDVEHRFLVMFYESTSRIDVAYLGGSSGPENTSVAGVQAGAAGPFTQYSCQQEFDLLVDMGARMHTVRYFPTRGLTVEKMGSGSGTVTSTAGIDCGATCFVRLDEGTEVTLEATPAGPREVFKGWSEPGCTGDTCTFTLDTSRTVTATFKHLPTCKGFEEDTRRHVVGGKKADLLLGTARDEVFCGAGKGDEMRGRGGKDLMLGGAGNDKVKGGPGSDRLKGNLGRDRLIGEGAADLAIGGPGDDVCKAEVTRSC